MQVQCVCFHLEICWKVAVDYHLDTYINILIHIQAYIHFYTMQTFLYMLGKLQLEDTRGYVMKKQTFHCFKQT